MAKITVEKPTQDKLDRLRVQTWSPWECDPSTFDWSYDTDETAYVLAGRVKVTCPDGQVVEFGAGDLVKFPRGLSCTWEVQQKIRKVYTFQDV